MVSKSTQRDFDFNSINCTTLQSANAQFSAPPIMQRELKSIHCNKRSNTSVDSLLRASDQSQTAKYSCCWGTWNKTKSHVKASPLRFCTFLPQFWSHPLGHFKGIFFSPPSQSDQNNFSTAYFNSHSLSLMFYLCDYVSWKNPQLVCTACQPRTGSKRNPSCFASSKHEIKRRGYFKTSSKSVLLNRILQWNATPSRKSSNKFFGRRNLSN